ncbi:HAD-IA family hydrolase [Patulibacter sp. SYSU D01012]|uniref:HAD-IA family hydrolase n=1 Tax=Patulibacter sp. SYSU D01012 TaxID=2817381 RepID=UPI001B308972|nr:HAD-IA family hydrolase [Patulibacter sp. SYSU D01012]
MGGDPAIRGLTIDAMGCLVTLEDPVPALEALLVRRGAPRGRAAIAAALRHEIAFYKAHHVRARDDAALRALQRACAELVARELDLRLLPGADPGAVDDAFVDGFLACLEFTVLPGVPAALTAVRDAGLPMVCVSNWDRGLPAHLERLGLAGFFRAVVTSGAVGAAKPDPAIFAPALDALGLPPSAVAHLGDEAVDRDGAAAAGLAYLEPPVATLPERLGLR